LIKRLGYPSILTPGKWSLHLPFSTIYLCQSRPRRNCQCRSAPPVHRILLRVLTCGKTPSPSYVRKTTPAESDSGTRLQQHLNAVMSGSLLPGVHGFANTPSSTSPATAERKTPQPQPRVRRRNRLITSCLECRRRYRAPYRVYDLS
jgi:hypothetical protein